MNYSVSLKKSFFPIIKIHYIDPAPIFIREMMKQCVQEAKVEPILGSIIFEVAYPGIFPGLFSLTTTWFYNSDIYRNENPEKI